MTDPNPSPTPAPAPAPAPSERPVRRFLRRRLEGWKLRHQMPFNFWIHVVGIPLAYPVTAVFLALQMWWWALGSFVLGFFLQWVGHVAEGNDVGEWAAIKRLLGLPYVGISPRWNPEDPTRL